MLSDLQFWLQGYPNKNRPRIAIWLGNTISSFRYFCWWIQPRNRSEHAANIAGWEHIVDEFGPDAALHLAMTGPLPAEARLYSKHTRG